MATTQNNRLLSIVTPKAYDYLLLNRIAATEGLSRLFSFEIELLHEEDSPGYEPTVVEAKEVLGQSVTITINQREEGTKRHYNGLINQFSQGNRNTRFSFYYATVVPHVWILTQNHQSRIFQHKSVPDILKEVLQNFEVSYEIQGEFKPRNFCVQYNESDFDFISRLMEEEGIFYFFEHSEDNHKMIIANTPQSHPDCPSKSEIPYFIRVQRSKEDFITSIRAWQTDHKLQSGKIFFRDYHFQKPTNTLEAPQPSLFNIADNQNMEIYEYPGGYARMFDDIDSSGGERSDVQNVFSKKQKFAEIAMQSLDAQYRVISAVSDCASISAGYKFKFKEHVDAGDYIIVSVTHEAEQNPTYVSDDEIEQPYTNNFSCIPYGKNNPPFRPVRKTPKPVIQSSQTAFVVGPAGEEIFTDKFGRVKVQFHWDRDGKYNTDSSCWIRVAKDLAGKKYGSMYIPRIGQEVIVDFLEGDPDQPIITGSVYNSEMMPHYELPKFKTLTYIKTRTSPDDGKGFNELRFEDKKGKEQVFIHSQKRMDTRVRQSFYETCGGNRQERIGVRSDNQPGGNLAITVGGNYDLHVKEAEFIGIDDKLNETVKADVVENYQGKQYTEVTGKRELNAQSITLEAAQKISLKVGGSFITIDLSGVTISGPQVKINSGGAAQGTSPAVIDDPLDAESADTGEPGYLDRPRSGGGRTRNRRTLSGQHAPPFETKTLPNGDIQVGNSIVVKKSATDPDFQDKVLKDLTTMSNHPTGMNTLNSLNNGGQTTTIQQTGGGNSTNFDNANDAAAKGKPDLSGNPGTGNGTGSTINYNPDREPPTAADPSVNRPADVGLHHEMVHAVHGAEGTDDNSPDPANPNNPSVEETETINKDNDYRKERGIPTRADHTVL